VCTMIYLRGADALGEMVVDPDFYVNVECEVIIIRKTRWQLIVQILNLSGAFHNLRPFFSHRIEVF
jgi:hypothetical protein